MAAPHRSGEIAAYPHPDDVTLSEFLTSHIESRTELKPGAQRMLWQVYRDLLAFFGDRTLLSSITRDDTNKFRDYLAGERKLADATVQRAYRRAAGFFNAAVSERLLEDNPFTPEGFTKIVHKGDLCRQCGGIRKPKPDEFYRISDNSECTLRHFFETVYYPRRLEHRSKKSTERMQTSLNQLAVFHGAEVRFTNLSDDLLERFALWLHGQGKSPATANISLRNILAVWRFAWKKRKVDELPRDVEMLPTPKRLPQCWTIEEFGQLLEAADNCKGSIEGIPANRWWRALLLTLYDTGLRLTATLHLKPANVDLVTGWLRVPADHQKQKAEQLFRLHGETVTALAAVVNFTSESLFPVPWQLSTRMAQRWCCRELRGLLESAALPHGQRDLFHKIRRTSASYLAREQGIAAATHHLGHSSQATTKAYLDPRITNTIHAADVLPRPAPPSSVQKTHRDAG
ncbi:phage integrase SAM-like domain-containing protein [Thalassoroseus pseudoceratinae]|uniref:phage integrase SAM-like domain-containing protein n=1 Tax=Thalassoroseus pseudoceratinae TaxID=2713176 RepID=UPI0014244208|nr:phage integrase SAM-like domain-containing protein [Thalassoroseus pseudoceratinae]